MCGTCGCSSVTTPDEHQAEPHEAHGSHSHPHGPHEHGSAEPRIVRLEEDLLRKNDHLAAGNRRRFERDGLFAVNFVSSPGAGKTAVLERMIRDRDFAHPVCVVQGDQATARDADRIQAAGAKALQINTGTGCHLDARMVARGVDALAPEPGTLVAIENVGNLVCPALFDLGEAARVAILSVPEGADKPLKYPYLFRGASLVLLNKIDLLPYVDFDQTLFEASLREVNPTVRCLEVSATRGDGLAELYSWIEARLPSREGRAVQAEVEA